MSRVLLYAHDPGGALMLSAAACAALSRGHELVFHAAGPSVRLWRKAGFDVVEDVATSLPKFDGIDIVVTGTGFSAREQTMWLRAQAAGLPSHPSASSQLMGAVAGAQVAKPNGWLFPTHCDQRRG